jgi:pimeloyl-ACP methyl ester carboxylesterase
MTLDDRMVSQVVFHPRGRNRLCATGLPTLTECGEARVAGYLHLSEVKDDLLLFFHGNGEIAADYDDLSSLYTSFGPSFWILDFRGYGRSSGSPSYLGMCADAERIFEDIPKVEKAGRQFRKVLVMGRSLAAPCDPPGEQSIAKQYQVCCWTACMPKACR